MRSGAIPPTAAANGFPAGDEFESGEAPAEPEAASVDVVTVEEVLIVDPGEQRVDWLALHGDAYASVQRSGLIAMGPGELGSRERRDQQQRADNDQACRPWSIAHAAPPDARGDDDTHALS